MRSQLQGEAHARITQQLAELLGPLARAAGLIPMMGEFNLGESEHDFRVPDGGLHRAGGSARAFVKSCSSRIGRLDCLTR